MKIKRGLFPKKCKNCKKIFYTWYCMLKNRKFCSDNCTNKYQKGKPKLKLRGRIPHNKGKTKENYEPLQIVSEKVSKTRKKLIKEGKIKIHWLGKKHKEKTKKKISKTRIKRKVAVKEKNPAWKGGIQNYRKYAFKDYNFKKICSVCNEKIKGYKCHIHHKDGNRYNNRKENLEVICAKHHWHKHR